MQITKFQIQQPFIFHVQKTEKDNRIALVVF